MNCGTFRKQAIDEAIVTIIITDCQPLSLVEDDVTADAIIEVHITVPYRDLHWISMYAVISALLTSVLKSRRNGL